MADDLWTCPVHSHEFLEQIRNLFMYFMQAWEVSTEPQNLQEIFFDMKKLHS